jgi:hypothetical protein
MPTAAPPWSFQSLAVQIRVSNLAQFPHLHQELKSTQVLVRFSLRLIILAAFATFSSIGFARSLAALLWMTIVLSAVVGAMKRERLFDATLNHWDETVAYTALFCLVHSFNDLGLSTLAPV